MKKLSTLLFFACISLFLAAQGNHHVAAPSLLAGHFPECERPEGFSLIKVWDTGCRLAWSEPEAVYGMYRYELGIRIVEAGINHPWQYLDLGKRLEASLEGLLPGQTYNVQLRRVCGSGAAELHSDWVKLPVPLRTAPLRANPEGSQPEFCGGFVNPEFQYFTQANGLPGLAITWAVAANAPSLYYQLRWRAVNGISTSPWMAQDILSGNSVDVTSLLTADATTEFEMRLVAEGPSGLLYCDWVEVGAISLSGALLPEEEQWLPVELPPFECGEPFSPPNLGAGELPSASEGDIFYIYGFPMYLIEVSGGSGIFSGTGIIPLPFGGKGVVVSFTNIYVNAGSQVVAGSALGIPVDPADYPALTLDTISVGRGICLETPQAEGFDENGIHSETGQPWDPRGFDQNGQYILQPPYPGYQEGMPYDPNYDPNGFRADGIHSVTGTIYNEAGCSQLQLDSLGQPCDPSGPSPYYFLLAGGSSSGPPTQAGLIFAETWEGAMDSLIAAILSYYLGVTQDSIDLARLHCNGIRADMEVLVGGLGYERAFIFGENDKYFEEGMWERFTSEPKPFGVAMDRDPNHVQLENRHVDLWKCDRSLGQLSCGKGYLLDQLAPGAVNATADEMLNKMRSFTAEQVSQYSQGDALRYWLETQLLDRLKSACSIGGANSFGQAPPRPAARRMDVFSSPMLAASGPGLLFEGQDQLSKADVDFLFLQGFQEIGGVDRAFYLEALDRARSAAGQQNVNVEAFKMPVAIEKEVLGQEYKIYLDEFVFTPQGVSCNAYFVLDIPTSGDRVVFKATGLAIGPTGLATNVNLELATQVEIRLNNSAKMILKGDGGTYVAWDCNGFAEMGVDGEIEFCRNYLVPLEEGTLEVKPDPERARAYFTTVMPAWGEFLVQLDVDPFAIAGVEDVKWIIEEATLDFSSTATPQNIVFPVNYDSPFVSSTGQASPLWRGFYLKELTVVLPKQMAGEDLTGGANGAANESVSVSVQHVIIDSRGFTGRAVVGNILPLSEGLSLGGWAFSLDTFRVDVIANNLVGIGFNGLINVPIFRGANVDSNAPLGPEDCFFYTAQLKPGNQYCFNVIPGENLDFKVPLWVAEANIYSNSSLSISIDSEGVRVEARLHGNIRVLGNQAEDLSVSTPSLTFQNLMLSNRAPYFSPACWDFPSEIGANLGGFEIGFSKINLDNRDSSRAALFFNMRLKLINEGSNLNIDAQGSFELLGELSADAQGRQRWVYAGLNVHGIGIAASFPGVRKLEGALAFFKDGDGQSGSVYGTGFRGYLSADFEALDAGVSVVALFGRKDGFRYFMVDAMVDLPPGTALAPGVDLRGFGGGISFKMSRVENDSGLPSTFPSTSGPLPAIGASLSGIMYAPDASKSLGLRAMVALTSATNEKAFSANGMFEILFNESFGLSQVRIQGNARFMAEMNVQASPAFQPSGAPNNGAAVAAYVDIELNFDARTFDANFEVYISAGLVQGGQGNGKFGGAEMHFGPSGWYINMGTPDMRNRLDLSAPVVGNVMKLQSYLCIGNRVPPMPSLPPAVASLSGAGNFMASENMRGTGRGFAFGASVEISTGELTFLIYYASLDAGVGFDIMLQDYGDAYCVQSGQQIGINGWYASGQAWAFIDAKIGIQATLFGSSKRYEILSIGAAAALQVKLPNPFWAQGSVGGRYSILGGLIKGNCQFQVTLGESCHIVGGEDPNTNLSVILDLSPASGSEEVGTDVQPLATFKVPYGQRYEIPDINNPSIIYAYEAKIQTVRLERLSSGVAVPGALVMDSVGYNLRFDPYSMLPANDSFRFEVKVGIFRDGILAETEERSHTFRTGQALDVIPPGNVAFSYPMDGQANFYKAESSTQSGYIQLKVGQPDLFFNIPEGWRQTIRITESSGGGSAVLSNIPVTYSASSRRITFPLPAALLQNGGKYKLSLQNIPPGAPSASGSIDVAAHVQSQAVSTADNVFTPSVPPPPPADPVAGSAAASASFIGADSGLGDEQQAAGGDTPRPHTIYEMYFRVSEYNTFSDKLDAIAASYQQYSEGRDLYVTYELGIQEPFDMFELGLWPGGEALISCEAPASSAPWFQTPELSALYRDFPRFVYIHTMFMPSAVSGHVDFGRPLELVGKPPRNAVELSPGLGGRPVSLTPQGYSSSAIYNLFFNQEVGKQRIINKNLRVANDDYRHVTQSVQQLILDGLEGLDTDYCLDMFGTACTWVWMEDQYLQSLEPWMLQYFPAAPQLPVYWPSGAYPITFRYQPPGHTGPTTVRTLPFQYTAPGGQN
jgi:hypothetical protein